MLNAMKQAILRFYDARPGCKLVTVSPMKRLTARANQCFDNAMALCLAKSQRYTLRSGWLVGAPFGLHVRHLEFAPIWAILQAVGA